MSLQQGEIAIRQRADLYRLIISQLFYDGHQSIAMSLSNLVKACPQCPPSDRLYHVTVMGLKYEEDHARSKKVIQSGARLPTGGIDLGFEAEVQINSPEPALYNRCYISLHKSFCRAGAFSSDGRLVATGCTDGSIIILDVDRVASKKSAKPLLLDAPESLQKNMESRLVIRTLYDHEKEVTALEFHPFQQLLISGSRDCTIKFFDYSKSSMKLASKTLPWDEKVRCMSIHPSGDHLLVATQHPTVRLCDVNTGRFFVSSVLKDEHKDVVTSIKYSPSAFLFVTGSKDGDIKVWDGVSSKCIKTFQQAHEGYDICSVAFSRNSKYIVSSGMDSMVRLWEVSTSRCLMVYTGAGIPGKQVHRNQAVFSHTEDYLMCPDAEATSLCCWESRNANRKQSMLLSSDGAVRSLAHSPVGPIFLTCSDDFQSRLWCNHVTTD